VWHTARAGFSAARSRPGAAGRPPGGHV